MVYESNTFVRGSTGSNYSGHGNKEQDKKERFVRFSEQPPGITTVYRLQKSSCNVPRDRFWENTGTEERREAVNSVAGIEQWAEEP